MRALLIYEEIPDSTKFYNLKLEGEDLERIKKFHGEVQNSTECTLTMEEMDWLAGKFYHLESGEPGPWQKFEIVIEKGSPIYTSSLNNQDFDLIIWTAFIL